MTNRITNIIITVLIISSSCSVPRSLLITENKRTGELTLNIKPTKKNYRVALIPLTPIFIEVEIPESIMHLSVFDNQGNLIWELKAINIEFGGGNIIYGKTDTKKYTQLFPSGGKAPKELVENNIYKIEFETLERSYQKSFIYQFSEIFITEKDKK